MRKVNIYVVTYNNEERINENFLRFQETTRNVPDVEFHYTIINNHSNFKFGQWAKNKNLTFEVWHNVTRPDWSCGHLARDYNAALVNGFRDLNNPACDQVICCHDDVWYKGGWFEKLTEIHKTYDFYAGDYGCSMTSYLPSAVKTIGIWDEKFTGIGFHEADFYLRALMYNGEKISINDHFGGRVYATTEVLFDHPPENQNKRQHSEASLAYHANSRKIFAAKWGRVHPEQWATRLKNTPVPKIPLIPQTFFYPWFEKDIDNLEEKGYIYAKAGLENFLEEWK